MQNRESSSTEARLRDGARTLKEPARAGGLYRYIVLGLLRDGAARHGYALMKDYRQRSGSQIGSGRFYGKLQRLAAEGLVTTAPNPPGADPRRTPYQITDTGAAWFDAWLRDPTATLETQREDDLCTRALLLGAADPTVVSATLNRWREEIWMRGASIENARERALAKRREASFDPLPLLLTRRLKHAAADVEFLDEFRRSYEQWTRRRANAHPPRSGATGSDLARHPEHRAGLIEPAAPLMRSEWTGPWRISPSLQGRIRI